MVLQKIPDCQGQDYKSMHASFAIFQFRIDGYCTAQASCTYDEVKQEVPQETYDAIKEVCTKLSDACKDAIGGVTDYTVEDNLR